MGRKPSGFWSRKEVQDLLERYVRQKISLEEAAARIATMSEREGISRSLGDPRKAVKHYAQDVRRKLGLLPPSKTVGVTVRLSAVAMDAFRDLARRTSRSLGSVVSEA
ncbi:MAG: hypothetical protein ACRDGN_00410, partial [bacterium]